MLLLVTPASTFSAFTPHGIGGHTRPRTRSVTRRLLQRCSSRRSGSNDGQVSTSVKCRISSGGQRYKQVLPWLVAAPAHRATLSSCTAKLHSTRWNFAIRPPASHHGNNFDLPADDSYRSITLPARHKGRSISVVGPSVWNSLPDYLRDSGVGRDKFRQHLKTFLFASYRPTSAYSALEVLHLCAI